MAERWAGVGSGVGAELDILECGEWVGDQICEIVEDACGSHEGFDVMVVVVA
jgi:hypothetical protein